MTDSIVARMTNFQQFAWGDRWWKNAIIRLVFILFLALDVLNFSICRRCCTSCWKWDPAEVSPGRHMWQVHLFYSFLSILLFVMTSVRGFWGMFPLVLSDLALMENYPLWLAENDHWRFNCKVIFSLPSPQSNNIARICDRLIVKRIMPSHWTAANRSPDVRRWEVCGNGGVGEGPWSFHRLVLQAIATM